MFADISSDSNATEHRTIAATRHSAAENECKSTEATLVSIDAQAQLGEAGLGQAAAAREADPDLQGPA
jgi:hypothetical protein